jgi:hypothetical protein
MRGNMHVSRRAEVVLPWLGSARLRLGFGWLRQEMAQSLSGANNMWLAHQWLGSARGLATARDPNTPTEPTARQRDINHSP